MKYEGYLDGNDGWTAFGWAFDSARPDEPVEVEFLLGPERVGSLKAQDFRPDLQQAGRGNGRHAFSFTLPCAGGTHALTARIRDTDFILTGSPMRLNQRQLIDLVAGDIVNQCNLRCPFCIVDYSNVKALKQMSMETFERAIELLPMTKPGNFWLSCLHEPTMHRQFIEFIERVPDSWRDRISFTTNLSRRVPDGTLERLANSGIHSIRVSFDTRQAELFAELRKKGKYELFESNLLKLSAALATSSRRPRLHFITMAFKDNYRDIADLVRYGRDLGAAYHEIRYIYYMPHLAHWGKSHILDMTEWAELERSLEPLMSPALNLCPPQPTIREEFEEERGLAEYIARENSFGGADDASALPVGEPGVIGRALPDEALRLRLRWDGVIITEQLDEDTFRVNLNKIERPAEYFESLRFAAIRASQ